MEREASERGAFPVGRRGYDAEAVDAHLRRVADEAELSADAGRQASRHVARVREAAGGMLSRLDDLERELGTLLEALRKSGERLDERLARLQREAGELGGAVAPAADDLVAPPPPADDIVPEPAGNGGPAGEDEAGARLIALSMALSGTPREETARYLAEHFTLPDPEALLDDVYERAGQ